MINPAIHTDSELLILMKEDQEWAFTEIYHRYQETLFITANNIIRDRIAAQDAVQEVFVAFWQRRKITDIESVKTYLKQAARFQVYKMIRAQRNDERFFERMSQVTLDILDHNPLIFKEQQQLLDQLLNTIPEEYKETFRLSRFEHLTYKEIASQLNISEKTVEYRMSKALKHLREGLTIEFLLLICITLEQLN